MIPSPLKGWGIDVLLLRVPPDSKVLLYEADEELRTRSLEYWTWKDPRVFRLDSMKDKAWENFVDTFPWSSIRRIRLLPLGSSWLLAAAEYRELEARLVRLIAQIWSNRLTCVEFGSLWLRHLVANVRGPRALWPDWGDDPIVVCGAGTTLERAIESLGGRSDRRIRILATDTALLPLAEAGVSPDAIVVLEAQHHNLADFAAHVGTEIPVFADLTVDPCAVRATRGRIAWFSARFAPLSIFRRWEESGLLSDVVLFPALGSVGIAACRVAWTLTRGPVFLTGLDFSFPAGKTHARGAPSYRLFWSKTNRLRGSDPSGSGLRPGIHRNRNSGWLTTAVLEGYGNVLAESAQKEAERTFFWGPSPSQLPLTALPAEATWLKKLPSLPPLSPLSPIRTLNLETAFESWLKDETTILDDLLEALSPSAKETGDLKSRIEKAAQNLDHLSFSFPDPDYRATTDWLSRLKAAAVWWKNEIGRKFL